MNTKFCRHCGKDKPIENFRPRRDSKDGRRAQCNECAKTKSKKQTPKVVIEEPVIYFEHDPYYQF